MTKLENFRRTAAAMRSGKGFNGVYLKFVKGTWSAGKDEEASNGRELVAHVDQTLHGWTKRGRDKKPVDYHVGRVGGDYVVPERFQLGDNDDEKWPLDGRGMPADPWQFGYLLPFTDPKTDEFFVFTTSSAGGKDALSDLLTAYADNAEFDPDDVDKLPLVTLETEHYSHPEYGRVDKPTFDIVDWVEPPDGHKTLEPPTPVVSLLPLSDPAAQIEHKRDRMDDQIPF